MSGFFGIDNNREVIRVHVKKCDGLMQPETKKFSLDPQITSFEMLKNILARAFDIQSDFTISYLSKDQNQEVYLSMLSDWDMDAAFQNASDPSLRLKVDLKPFDDTLEDWDIIAPVEIPQFRMNFLEKGTFLGNITGTISNQVEKTVSQVQKAMGIKSEDEELYRPVKAPMTDMEFRNYLDSDGRMVKPEEFRLSIYQGGVEPSLRRVVWRHLLNIFPEELSGRERFDYMKRKENEYLQLRDRWRELFNSGQVSMEAKHVASLVKKDVLRTDRTHKYYAGGDDSKNLISLYHLLVTYALTHPNVSYCQGMSDIASPLLVVQKEEAQAYLCFCGLMKRLTSNFLYDGEAITTKLKHLSTLVKFYDPTFQEFLKKCGAEDLFFCYRWILLEMKREFPFEDALYMLEVMWSTLPPSPAEGGLELTDPDFSPNLLMLSSSPHSPTFAMKQTQYAHLIAKRRMTVTPFKDVACSPKNNVLSSDKNGVIERDITVIAKNLSNSFISEKKSVVPSNDAELKNVNDQLKGDNSNGSQSLNGDNSNELSTNGDETNELATKGDYSNELSTNGSETNELSTKGDYSFETSSSKEDDSKDEEFLDCNSNRSVKTSVSTSMSSSQSIDRFPSLISASFIEDRGEFIDDEPEFIGPSQSCIGVPKGSNELPLTNDTTDDSSEVFISKLCNQTDVNEDDMESQSQFYISLEEPSTKHVEPVSSKKKSMKKSVTIPEIKGSFFSGMRKILSSPKRRPGKAQQVTPESDPKPNEPMTKRSTSPPKTLIKDTENKIGDISVVQNGKKSTSSSENSSEGENTLFELGLSSEKNSSQRERLEVDSGNGSLTSSLNSVNSSSSKSRAVSNASNHSFHRGIDSGKDNGQAVNKEVQKKLVMNSVNSNDTDTATTDGKYPVFCDNHFELNDGALVRNEEVKDDGVSDCIEVIDFREVESSRLVELPSPEEFGYGNPFLMFLCLTVLLQHRDVVMKTDMEYDELAMYFDKMVRKHNVNKVLYQTRKFYTEYIRMQHKKVEETERSLSSVSESV